MIDMILLHAAVMSNVFIISLIFVASYDFLINCFWKISDMHMLFNKMCKMGLFGTCHF